MPRQAEGAVEHPVEDEGVDQKEQQQAQIEHKGLPQRDVQPPGKEGHQRDDQPAFEADGVCRAPGQAAPAHGLARLPALEQGVEHEVPGYGNG